MALVLTRLDHNQGLWVCRWGQPKTRTASLNGTLSFDLKLRPAFSHFFLLHCVVRHFYQSIKQYVADSDVSWWSSVPSSKHCSVTDSDELLRVWRIAVSRVRPPGTHSEMNVTPTPSPSNPKPTDTVVKCQQLAATECTFLRFMWLCVCSFVSKISIYNFMVYTGDQLDEHFVCLVASHWEGSRYHVTVIYDLSSIVPYNSIRPI